MRWLRPRGRGTEACEPLPPPTCSGSARSSLDGSLGRDPQGDGQPRPEPSQGSRHRLNDPAQDGGALLDLGVYPVTFAIDVLGAAGHHPGQRFHDGTRAWTGKRQQSSSTRTRQQALLDRRRDISSNNRAVGIGTEGWTVIRVHLVQPAPFTGVRQCAATSWTSSTSAVTSRGRQFQSTEMERLVRQPSPQALFFPRAGACCHGRDGRYPCQIRLKYDADAPVAAVTAPGCPPRICS